jgi:response regulator RpfG family c-di-GMP phosphodiesterase
MKPSTDRVLIVDDEPAVRKMLGVMLSQAGIANESAGNAQAALDVLPSRRFSAVISDLRMPGLSGLELLAEVQRKYPELVFLVATGVDDVRVGVHAMRQGADDYLVKPFQLDMVLASLERAFQKKALQQELENYRRHLEEMIAKRTQQLQTAIAQLEHSYSATLEALGSAIDLRDGPTAGHSRRVFWYSIKIAQGIGGLEKEVRNLGMGAWLHDIGKLATPDGILLKPGALTPQEREVMERHVQTGYDLVKSIPFLADAAEIILAHHERWDGSGYPRGLKAEEIPLGARIFAVADSFDAMTSDRPYRSAIPFEAARDEIQREAGKLFDRTVVNVFLTIAVNEWAAIREEAASAQINTFANSGGLSFAPVDDANAVREASIQLHHFADAHDPEGASEKTRCQPKPV